MREPTVSEILAYLMSVGLSDLYQGPTQLIKRMVINTSNTCLFSFLVFGRNQRNWLHALVNTMDPAGFLQLKTQLDNNIEALLVWIYSTCVNVSGIMHPFCNPPVIRREPTEFPGFLLTSQIASLMLVETEYLLPLIAPIVWTIFGAVMALRYPTKPVKVAANAPHTQFCNL